MVLYVQRGRSVWRGAGQGVLGVAAGEFSAVCVEYGWEGGDDDDEWRVTGGDGADECGGRVSGYWFPFWVRDVGFGILTVCSAAATVAPTTAAKSDAVLPFEARGLFSAIMVALGVVFGV